MIITGCLFGVQCFLNKFALDTLSPLTIGLGRVGIGFFTLFLLFPFFLKREKKEDLVKAKWYHYATLGFFEGALPCLVLPLGQLHIPSSIASMLISTMPFFAIVFAAMLKLPKEQLSLHKVVSIALGFIGIVFIIHPSTFGNVWTDISPALFVTLASISWGLGLALIHKFPPVHPIRLCRNFLFWATIELSVIWILFGHPLEIRFTAQSLGALILLGTINSGIVYIFYVILTRCAGVAFTSFSNYIVPIVGLSLGVLVLHEKVTWTAIVGLAIVFAGLTINSFYMQKK